MAPIVLDSSAIIAFFAAEAGGPLVKGYLEDADRVCYAHTVNLIEVFYDVQRRYDRATAESVIHQLRSNGVEERADLDEAFWHGIADFKATRKRVSLADCFCVALARRLGAELVTADRREFGPLVPEGLCPITFIR